MKASLLLVDDHPMVREGLKAYLGLQANLQVAGEAGSIAEAKSLLAKLQPSLVLLDAQLPDGNAITSLPDLIKLSENSKFIILTSFLEAFWVQEAMRLGASGYVLKHSGPKVLVDYLQAVLRGERALDPSAMKLLDNPKENPLNKLTQREHDILTGIANGQTNKQIATSLNIAEKTVKAHATSVFAKLEVRDRVQAALLAKDLNL